LAVVKGHVPIVRMQEGESYGNTRPGSR
jgi:hypothetical protein